MAMKKTIKSAALVSSIVLLLWATSAFAQNPEETSDVQLEILAGSVTIGAPATIDLWTGTVSSQIQDHQIAVDTSNTTWTDTGPSWIEYSYFWLEDLKSAAAGYATTLQSTDLVKAWSWTAADRTITSDLISIDLTWGTWSSVITVLDWLDGTGSYLPPEINVAAHTKSALDSAKNIMNRIADTSPDAWVVWKYGVRPTIHVDIPKYQQIGQYTATLTYTLIEG
jgi:hypothetical protein